MNKQEFISRILKIKMEVAKMNEVSAMIEQNCDFAERSPSAATLAKVDLLSASKELAELYHSIDTLVHSLQEYEPPPRWPLVVEVFETE